MLTLNLLIKKFEKLIHKKALFIGGLFVFFSLLQSCDLFSSRILNKSLVEVGSYKLTAQDFSKSLASRLKNLDALSAKDPNIIQKFKDRVVTDFIVESFILIWFDEQKLSLTNEEIEQEIKSLQSGYPNDVTFREALADESLTFAQWKRRVEIGLKRKAVFNHLRKSLVPATDAELESYYNNNKELYLQKAGVLLSDILVQDENQADIVKKLTKTQKFSDLIKKFSLSTDASSGGNFGWVEQDSNIDFDKIFKARVGEIVGPIKMSDGYRLFRIEQKRIQRQKTFAESKEKVKNDVASLRETARFSAWLDEQVKKQPVYKNTEAINKIYIETR